MNLVPKKLLVSVLLLGALAFACGGNDSGTGGGGVANDGGSGNNQTASADLRLAGGDPITMDPALASDASSAEYIVEIFGGLVTLDKDLKVVPDLAESWDVSQDGTVYTFKIRRNALFHDNKPVTANDFKYSFDRTAKLGQTTSTTAEAYLGDIVGARDVTRGRADSISGVTVIDSQTLQITIDAPKAYFLAKLTYPTAFVVDRQQVESNPRNWTRRPNGTGPYKMQEWRLNERIILEANDRYHLGAPAVKRVLYVLAGGSALTQYENDELDVVGIGVNDIERVASPRDPLNAEYKSAPQLSISYVGLNTKSPPFDDPNVRRAFAMAIDREQIARVVMKNMIPVANSIMMPGLPGYNAGATTPQFNPTEAKRILGESKYGTNLPPLTITEIGGGANAGVATQAIIEMWRTNLGIDVSIAQSEQASFFEDLDAGRLQMFDIGWIMDYPDPEDVIDILFYSNSRQNNTRYSNPDFDRLIDQARVEQDSTRRLQLYQQAEGILLQDVPWIPMFFGKSHELVKPYVKGYEPTPIVVPKLRYITIQK